MGVIVRSVLRGFLSGILRVCDFGREYTIFSFLRIFWFEYVFYRDERRQEIICVGRSWRFRVFLCFVTVIQMGRVSSYGVVFGFCRYWIRRVRLFFVAIFLVFEFLRNRFLYLFEYRQFFLLFFTLGLQIFGERGCRGMFFFYKGTYIILFLIITDQRGNRRIFLIFGDEEDGKLQDVVNVAFKGKFVVMNVCV